MLPFSKIACGQCRQFAFRSFASAVAASTPSTSSNPASAPLAKQPNLGGTATKDVANGDVPDLSPIDGASVSGAVISGTVNDRSTKQPQSTLARFLQEQRQHLVDKPVTKKLSPSSVSIHSSKPVQELKYTIDSNLRRRRRLGRSFLKGRYKKSLGYAPPTRQPKTAQSFETIIIKPLSEEAAQEVAQRRSSRKFGKFGKFAAPPSLHHGRKKKKVPFRTSVRSEGDPSKDHLGHATAGASGFDSKDGLAPSSESGFAVASDHPDDRMHAAVAAMQRLAAKVDASDDTLKGLFEGYLDPNADAAARRRILDDVKSHLQENTSDPSDEISQALEEELKLVMVQQDSEVGTVEGTITAPEVQIDTVAPIKDAEIATLAHGLQRVLFNPGIHWLQHPRTGFYNYTKDVQPVADREDFDFNRLPKFVRPSQDPDLRKLLKQSGRKFAGSTSSLTSAMSQIYFALNGNKKLNTQTANFVNEPRKFTAGARNPASIVLRLTDEGTYLVDADKSVDTKEGNPGATVLSELGHVLERQLTMEPGQFSRFLKSSPEPFEPHEMREKREAYYYSASKNMVMRSQLDCHDDRLPRRTFDIKTRATVAIRMDTLNYKMNRGYLISKAEGPLESFEREKYDLIRSAFLKYSMQVRIGNMDGIFLAYHSTGQIFGFEYLSLEDLDKAVSGSHEESTQAFHLCVGLLETIFERVTADQPGTTLRLHFQGEHGRLQVFAEARPDLSLSSAELEGNAEIKENGDAAQIASDGVRLYAFQISSYLNGHEVPKDKPVDFASVPIEHMPIPASTASPVENSGDLQAEASTAASKSAFESFLSQRQNRDSATSLAVDERNLEDIVWSIKYTISESRDQKRVVKALKKLRELQKTFSKYVLLPEGLPPQLVSSLVGNSSRRAKQEESSEASQIGQGAREVQSSNQEMQKQQSEAGDNNVTNNGDRAASTSQGDPVLKKWAAFKPRSGVRYTTNPTGLIAKVRRLAAKGRSRIAAAAKASNKQSPDSHQ